MNKRLGDFTLRNLMIVYVIVYTIMPIVQRLTSRFLTAYFYMAVVVALVVLTLVLDRPENLSLYGTFLLPFIIYELLSAFNMSEDFLMWSYQVLLFLLPVILGYYFTQDKTRLIDSYSKIVFFALAITTVTTIIGCIRFPNAARELALVESQDSNAIQYDMHNIGGYGFVYTIVLLYPAIILSYKERRIKLITALLFAVVILLMIVFSEYTIALLFFIISSMLFFTKRNLSFRSIIIASVIAILFLLVFTNFIPDFLRWLGEISGSKTMGSRLDALAGGREGLENSEDTRVLLYQKSWNSFLQHPIFGSLFEKEKINGAHSFIIDNLALYGIFGGVIMFFMYRNIFKRFFLPYKDKPGYGYIVWIFIQTLILSLVNTGMWLDVLCLFVPIWLHWIYGNETETEEVNDEAAVDSQLTPGASGGEAIRTTE
ncbi:O-antigen ligase family protein [Ruminococcus sp.]|uniref:O-antigen ligase family protein n=1 Tax=Ruminococcus sp. TaxID=41978 RepID=UPI00388DEC74